MITASPQSHLLRNVASLPDSRGKHRPQTVEELMHVGWGHVTCRVSQQPTEAAMEGQEEKKERVAGPRENTMANVFYDLRETLLIRSELSCSSTKQFKMGTAVSLGRQRFLCALEPGAGPRRRLGDSSALHGLGSAPTPCSSSCHVHRAPCDCKKGKSQAGNQLSVLCPLSGAQ